MHKMNIFAQSIISLRRDWRSGELRLIAIAIVIAVASLTSVHFFTDRVKTATEHQATELLAADLVLRSPEPIDESIQQEAHSSNLITTRTISFRSVVLAGEALQMSEVKAIEDGYPIRGKLRTTETLFGAESISSDIPEPGTVWADPRLLQILGLEVGDNINLGALTFPISKVLTYEPDRGGDFFNIAPRLLMNLADLPATKLIVPGSRAQYRLLLGGNINDVTDYRNTIEANEEYNRLRIQGIRDARPELRRALERSEQFLGLAALVSVALAGLAVAMSAQRYATRHFDNCAIMRCLGAEQGTITSIYFIQLVILSLIASIVGCAIGFFAQEGLATMAVGFTREELPSASFYPVFLGITTGMVTVLGFAMPQILRLRNVTPLRVLRKDLAPAPLKSWTTYGIAIVALALLTPWQSGNAMLTLYTFCGIIVTALLLLLCTKFLISFINRFRSRVGVSFRYGLANIARRKSQSAAQILGIGLGVMVMILLTLIRTDLLANWRDRIPEGTPNYFLINIQPAEVDGLRTFLQSNQVDVSQMYPMIRARLTDINGDKVNPDDYEGEARRMVDRSYNLSWSQDLKNDNRVVEGEWWGQQSDGKIELSLEEDFANDFGLKLHDTMTFNIGGQVATGEITSLRYVNWDSFNANFFVVANPGSLDNYPGTWITSFYIDQEKRPMMVDIVRQFPSITVMDVDAILTQVRTIMNQVIRTVEFVFGFTLLSGLIVLFAALQTTHDERTFESALLSSLGANRNQILSSLVAEFMVLGLAAGILAAFAATIIESIIASVIFQMDVIINPWVWLIGPLVCVSMIVVGGLLGTWKVLKTPPMVVLRQT
jgi:putative ABC transport system permease protein